MQACVADLQLVMSADEPWFYQRRMLNSQNDSDWSAENSCVIKKYHSIITKVSFGSVYMQNIFSVYFMITL